MGKQKLYKGTVKFNEVVRRMAKHPGSLQERLVPAMTDLIGLDMPGAMPEELMDLFRELVALTTSVDPASVDIAPHFKDEGSITATCMTMKEPDAIKAAELIVHLDECLEEIAA